MGKSGGKNSTKKSPPPGVPSSASTPPPTKEEKKPPPTKAVATEFDYSEIEIDVTEPEAATTVATADTSIPALELAPSSVDASFEAMNFEEVIAAATPAPIPTAMALPTAEEQAAEIPKNAEGVPLYSPAAWARKKAREQRK